MKLGQVLLLIKERPIQKWIGRFSIGIYFLITLGPVIYLCVDLCANLLTEKVGVQFISARSWVLLKNTFFLSASVSLTASTLGLGTALWLMSGHDHLRKLIRKIIIAPFIIPSYVYALTWMSLFSRSGLVNQILSFVGLSISPYGSVGTYTILSMIYSPIVAWFVTSSADAIDTDFIDSARILQSDFLVWRKVIIPFIFPTLVSATGLIFVLCSVEYGVPALMQFNVYAMEIYAEFSQSGDPSLAMAISVPLLITTTIVIALSQLSFGRTPLIAKGKPQNIIDKVSQPNNIKKLAQTSAGVTIASIFIPLLVLLWQSGGAASILNALFSSQEEMSISIILGFAVGCLAVIIALYPAKTLTNLFHRKLWFLYFLPLAIPAPLFGIGIIELWNLAPVSNFYGNVLPLLVAHVGRLLPFALIALANQFRQVDWSFYEISLFSPVKWYTRLVHVTFPLLFSGIIIGFGIVYMLSLGELGASLLVVPPGFATMPLRLYNLLHYGSNTSVAGLTLAMFVVLGFIGWLTLLLSRGSSHD